MYTTKGEPMVTDWKRDELFMLFSKRTNRKDKENYIVNAIWHRLNNMELQPVTQQCVRFEDGTRALIDLYFPQINYGVECDEEYHKNNVSHDKERELKIEQILSSVNADNNFHLERIDATASLEQINDRINRIVNDINYRTTRMSLKWKSVDERIQDVIKKGTLKDSDLIPFPTEASVGPCFNKHPESWRKSYLSISPEFQLWFPKLAIKGVSGNTKAASGSGWIDELSDDWKVIHEYNIEHPEKMGHDNYQKKKRIVFAQSKDVYGKKAFRFIGVYKHIKTDKNGHEVYEKIASEIDLKPFFV